MTRRNTLFLLFILRGLLCTAQSAYTDSLTVWLSQSEQLSRAENGTESLVLAEKALKLAEKMGNKSLISWACRHVGMAYYATRQDDKAVTYYLRSIENQDGSAEVATRLTAEYAREKKTSSRLQPRRRCTRQITDSTDF
jgi:tetratricopeptide (TPR) repeat protein